MRKILKGNLDCIGCPNYHVTKNGKVYSKLVYKYIKKRKRYEKDFERTHSMEG